MEDNDKQSGDSKSPQQPGNVIAPTQADQAQDVQPQVNVNDTAVAQPETVPGSNATQSNPISTQEQGAAVEQPVATAQSQPISPPPQIDNAPTATQAVGEKRKRSFKIPAIILVAIVLLLGGTAGAYFGYVVPNKPENVWSSAMVNMGTAYDEIIGYSTEMQDAKGVNTSGDFLYTYDGKSLTGSLNASTYESNISAQLTLKQNDFSAKFDLLAVAPEGSEVPNLFFKVSELTNLNEIAGANADYFNSYVDQWYTLDLSDTVELEEQDAGLTDDYDEVAAIIGDVSKEFVFTDDNEKSIFEIDDIVGKETNYEKDTYHYKISFNKENLNLYLSTLEDQIKNTKVGESLGDDFNLDNYTGDIDKFLEENKTVDVWVNTKTKLVQTIRIENNDNDSYADIGQLYEGGSEIPVFLSMLDKGEYGDNKTDARLTLNKDSKTAKLQGSFVNTTQNGAKFEFKADIKPSNEQLELVAPKDAKSIFELLFGSYYSGSGFQESLGISTDMSIINPQTMDDQFEAVSEFIEGFLEQVQSVPQN